MKKPAPPSTLRRNSSQVDSPSEEDNAAAEAKAAYLQDLEERLAKINDMRDKLARKLADPELYEDARKGELETWNKKYAEVMDGLHRAEALWLEAQEKLETAEAA